MEETVWAIVEVMGHKQYAGAIERRQLLRVTVPETPNNPEYVKEFGFQSVFSLTPCSESVARRAAEILNEQRRRTAYDELVSIPIYDDHGLNLLDGPMSEIDLDAARTGDFKRNWEANRTHESAVPGGMPF
ncbi:MAG: hypothetical protein OEZ65_15905 [Gemmatimonadota bacterium]|nr:hypothetical protein [Gemmatimonadota bacterium]